MITRITPFLWFDHQAEEAVAFYTSIFPSSKVRSVVRYDAAGAAAAGRPEGSAMTVDFELDGRPYVALNGGPDYRFTEAVSFQISCADQDEVDRYWDTLVADGGEEGPCGWVKDRFGLSWQVVPAVLPELLTDPDPERANRAMAAMLKMTRLDIAALRAAADGA